MTVTHSDIQQAARLACIDIGEDQLEEVTRRIGDILSMVDKMQSIDTSDVAPMANPHDAGQRLRRDKVTETDRREAFQAIAPQTENGLYLVPRVVE